MIDHKYKVWVIYLCKLDGRVKAFHNTKISAVKTILWPGLVATVDNEVSALHLLHDLRTCEMEVLAREQWMYSCKGTIDERFYPIITFHVMAQPYLDDFMLCDWRCNNIQNISQCRKANTLEVLA
jgi:hypothetical protein